MTVQGKRWSMAAAAAVLLTGCARPGDLQAGSPEAAPGSVTVVVSAAGAASPAVPAPVPASMTPAPSGKASCAMAATAMPSVDPSASFDINDPRQRALRELAQQQPTPQRGVVPQAAVPGAEACVHALNIRFTLLTSGSRTVPDEQAIDETLRAAGLTNIVIRSGPAFAASTGAACIYGTFTTAEPAFAIGPPTTDGSCRP
jgi:hypothetical protein